MARSLIGLMLGLLVLVAIFAVGAAYRADQDDKVLQDANEEPYVKCKAVGANVGMSITWGVPKSKCMKRCGPTAAEGGWTYEKHFIEAFTVNFDKACGCFSGGKKIVKFRPVNKAQAEMCTKGESMQIKQECWKAYMKARGTRYTKHDSRKVPRYSVPFEPRDFVVEKMCGTPCEENCNEVIMPGALDGMDSEDKAELGHAIKKIIDGDVAASALSRDLKDLIAILPERDLDDAEFNAIDADGNGQLSKDALLQFYSAFSHDQIIKFIEEADANGNAEIDPDEFQAFKEAMRNFQPDVDLVPVAPIDLNSESDGKAQWKAVVVECMKNGQPAPGECDGIEEEAKENLRMGC